MLFKMKKQGTDWVFFYRNNVLLEFYSIENAKIKYGSGVTLFEN